MANLELVGKGRFGIGGQGPNFELAGNGQIEVGRLWTNWNRLAKANLKLARKE